MSDYLNCDSPLSPLAEALRADPSYAWAWHCNLAMMAFDAGAPVRAANERAADFMNATFGVNTRDRVRCEFND